MKAPISRFVVYGNSMTPRLRAGQNVLSFNWAYLLGGKPKVGDILVVKFNGKEMIKRVQEVRGDEVFIEGDNEHESTDSRHFGPISLDQVVGKVIYTHQTYHNEY